MFERHAAVGAVELERLKRALLAAAYTQHGVDLAALFRRFDADGSGTLDLGELGPHLQKMLPGVLSGAQLRRLLSAADADGNGELSMDELVAFVESRERAVSPRQRSPQEGASGEEAPQGRVWERLHRDAQKRTEAARALALAKKNAAGLFGSPVGHSLSPLGPGGGSGGGGGGGGGGGSGSGTKKRVGAKEQRRLDAVVARLYDREVAKRDKRRRAEQEHEKPATTTPQRGGAGAANTPGKQRTSSKLHADNEGEAAAVAARLHKRAEISKQKLDTMRAQQHQVECPFEPDLKAATVSVLRGGGVGRARATPRAAAASKGAQLRRDREREQRHQAKLAARKKAEEDKAAAELAECTFRPRLSTAPGAGLMGARVDEDGAADSALTPKQRHARVLKSLYDGAARTKAKVAALRKQRENETCPFVPQVFTSPAKQSAVDVGAGEAAQKARELQLKKLRRQAEEAALTEEERAARRKKRQAREKTAREERVRRRQSGEGRQQYQLTGAAAKVAERQQEEARLAKREIERGLSPSTHRPEITSLARQMLARSRELLGEGQGQGGGAGGAGDAGGSPSPEQQARAMSRLYDDAQRKKAHVEALRQQRDAEETPFAPDLSPTAHHHCGTRTSPQALRQSGGDGGSGGATDGGGGGTGSGGGNGHGPPESIAKAAAPAPAPAVAGMTDVFGCEADCGFKGSFDEVTRHEAVCAKLLAAAGAR
jgi:hypothetical protein